MFHSMATHAEYVSSLAQSIADLVEFELEYSKFSEVEVSMATGEEDRDTASASIHKKGVKLIMMRYWEQRQKRGKS